MGVAGAAASVSAAASVAGVAHSLTAKPSSSASNAAGQQAADYRLEAEQLWQNLQTPSQDKTPLEAQKWLQDYNPTNYTPQTGTLTQSKDDPAAYAAQQQALQQLQALAKGGLQPSDLLALQQIQQSQAGAASSQNLAAQQALQARGIGGAGASEAAMLAANQGAANSTQNLYSTALQNAANRQVNAINSAGSAASSIRGQTNSISQQMANNANAFNTQTIGIQNAAAVNAMNNSNAAQQYNLAGRQNMDNSQVATRNANVALQNQLAQSQFNNQSSIISGQSNALNGMATQASAQQAALMQQALGQNQSITSALNGVSGLAKNASDLAGSNGGNNWFNNLFNGNNSADSWNAPSSAGSGTDSAWVNSTPNDAAITPDMQAQGW